MNGAERRAVAEFLTGRSVDGDVSGASKRAAAMADATASISNSGWRGGAHFGQYRASKSAADAGLSAADAFRSSR
jgi:hypothetical protein